MSSTQTRRTNASGSQTGGARSGSPRVARYIALELKRLFRDPVTVFFSTLLPAFMYVIFGASMEWGQYPIGRGNISMYSMIGMAAYGAVVATTGIGGMAAVERMQGWGRQLGLTPLRDIQFVAVKSTVAVVLALIPITLIYAIGWFTGSAKADPWVWVASFVIVLAGSSMFALYGLCAGLLFRSESAVGGAAGMLVILGFLGNVFTPLTGILLSIAKFTPLYGLVTLSRYPLTDQSVNISTGGLITLPVWQSLGNVAVWTVIFAVSATLLARRGRARQ